MLQETTLRLNGLDNLTDPIIMCKADRPWGWYDAIESGEDFQVKNYMLNPAPNFHCKCTTNAQSIGW